VLSNTFIIIIIIISHCRRYTGTSASDSASRAGLGSHSDPDARLFLCNSRSSRYRLNALDRLLEVGQLVQFSSCEVWLRGFGLWVFDVSVVCLSFRHMTV